MLARGPKKAQVSKKAARCHNDSGGTMSHHNPTMAIQDQSKFLAVVIALGMLLPAPSTWATSIDVAKTYLQVIRTTRDGDHTTTEVLGTGYVRADIDAAFGAIHEFAELREFCDNNYEGNEQLCDPVGDSFAVEAPVTEGHFTMFGATVSGDDFQWAYVYDPYTELQLSIFIAIGGFRWCLLDGCEPSPNTDPLLAFSSDGEGGSFGYRWNGFHPLGSPDCDGGVCEYLTWSDEPPLGISESGTLPLALLGLVGIALRREVRARGRPGLGGIYMEPLPR